MAYLDETDTHNQDIDQERQSDLLSSPKQAPGDITLSPNTNPTPEIGTKICRPKEVPLCCKGDRFDYEIDEHAFPLSAERAALIISTWNNSPHLKGFSDSIIGYGNCPDCEFWLPILFSIYVQVEKDKHRQSPNYIANISVQFLEKMIAKKRMVNQRVVNGTPM